jgi:hypothetical protein
VAEEDALRRPDDRVSLVEAPVLASCGCSHAGLD